MPFIYEEATVGRRYRIVTPDSVPPVTVLLVKAELVDGVGRDLTCVTATGQRFVIGASFPAFVFTLVPLADDSDEVAS